MPMPVGAPLVPANAALPAAIRDRSVRADRDIDIGGGDAVLERHLAAWMPRWRPDAGA